MYKEINENRVKRTFSEKYRLSAERIEKYGFNLYHGIRFDDINRLESILQTGAILPSSKIKDSFVSFDGTVKDLYIWCDSDENCNRGKFVSVMPDEDDLEFRVFVREHIFFAIKGSIKAYETTHVSYDEYCEIKDKSEDYYSYAFNEYFVPEGVSLDDVLYIGIDSRFYSGDYEKTVEDVINLLKVYKKSIPFKDVHDNNELFCYQDINNNKRRAKENKRKTTH